MNLEENRDEIKKIIGYVSDTPDLFLKIPAINYWKFIAQVYNIDESTFNDRIKHFTEVFNMQDNFNKTIGEFSHGMRQKTFVIGALLSDPKVWILDEPLVGLDPEAAYNLKELMKKHAHAGNTVLFSTHVLETAEQICDRIGIIKNGEIIFVGTLKELREQYTGNTLEEIYLNMMNLQKEKSDTEFLDGSEEGV